MLATSVNHLHRYHLWKRIRRRSDGGQFRAERGSVMDYTRLATSDYTHEVSGRYH